MLRQDLVLSVSPAREDHVALRQLLEGQPWVVRESHSLRSALMVLEEYRIPVVLCEAELHPGSWRDLLAQLARTANPPSVIISSRRADENLRAEVLNAVGVDVLAKPVEPCDLLRALSDGLRRWKEQLEGAATGMSAAR